MVEKAIVKCASCKNPLRDVFITIGATDTKFPSDIRGKAICVKCSEGWSQPVALKTYKDELEVSVDKIKDGISSLKNMYLDNEWRKHLPQNMMLLNSIVQDISDSLTAKIKERHSVTRAPEINAILAEKAIKLVDDTAKLLWRTSSELEGAKERPPDFSVTDNETIMKVANEIDVNATALRALVPKLQVLASIERYKSGKEEDITVADSLLNSAIVQFDQFLHRYDTSLISVKNSAEEDIKQIRIAAHNMIKAHAELSSTKETPSPKNTLQAIIELGLDTKSRMDKLKVVSVVNKDPDKTDELAPAYAELARLFALLNMDDERTWSFVDSLDLHLNIAEMYLDNAKLSMEERYTRQQSESIRLSMDQMVRYLEDAKKHFQAAQSLWTDKGIWSNPATSQIDQKNKSVSVMPAYESHIQECDTLIKQLTDGNNLTVY